MKKAEKERDFISEVQITKAISEILKKEDKIKEVFVKEFLGIDCLGDSEIKNLKVIAEYIVRINILEDASNNRIDLVLFSENCFIPIEFKVYTNDDDGQLDDYVHEMILFYEEQESKGINKKSKMEKLLYYISPNRSEPEKYKGEKVKVKDLFDDNLLKCLKDHNNEIYNYLNKLKNNNISKNELKPAKIKKFNYFRNDSMKKVLNIILDNNEYLNNRYKTDVKRIGNHSNISFYLREENNAKIYFSLERVDCQPYWGILLQVDNEVKFNKKEILETIRKEFEKEGFLVSRIPWNGNWVFYKYIDSNNFDGKNEYSKKILKEIEKVIKCFTDNEVMPLVEELK